MREQHQVDGQALVQRLRGWARELGFSQIGVADVDLHHAEKGLRDWLDAGFHGGMDYMAAHGLKRARPAELVAGTVRVISARMDYLPRDAADGWVQTEEAALRDPQRAVISVYARGRDYHKVLRSRLQKLAERLAAEAGPFGHRVFTDSAPVLEVELATRAGLGWRGKHTLALARDAGSMFFLGEIFVDLALPTDVPTGAHCGSCSACIQACPTQAIVAPYRLDARRCISYLTIEHAGPIAPALRRSIGNRIYGCDDCQRVCPWNKYAQRSTLPDFDEREGLGQATLLALWAWTEADFLRRTEGSAIRRIGWARWRRNLAVALGNAWADSGEPLLAQALAAARGAADELVAEHIDWALAQRAVLINPPARATAPAMPAAPPCRSVWTRSPALRCRGRGRPCAPPARRRWTPWAWPQRPSAPPAARWAVPWP
jgi:epoxyqueuosine reductase